MNKLKGGAIFVRPSYSFLNLAIGTYELEFRTFMMCLLQDVRPFCTGERCVKTFSGHSHNFEKNLLHCAWSPDGELVAAGSSDR